MHLLSDYAYTYNYTLTRSLRSIAQVITTTLRASHNNNTNIDKSSAQSKVLAYDKLFVKHTSYARVGPHRVYATMLPIEMVALNRISLCHIYPCVHNIFFFACFLYKCYKMYSIYLSILVYVLNRSNIEFNASRYRSIDAECRTKWMDDMLKSKCTGDYTKKTISRTR